MRSLLAASFVSALTLIGAQAQAALISVGVPVDSVGAPVAAGNINGDDSINFYIPLSGGYAGVFGVGGVGQSGSSFSGNGGAGYMDMFLSFSPTAGGNTLQFLFEDFDLLGIETPTGFLENVAIYNAAMTMQLAFVDSANDPEVVSADPFNQELRIDLTSLLPLGDPFIAKLRFSAGPVRGWNTVETVKANLIRVPEPSSLALFGIGFLGLTLLGARQRRRAAT